jgi:hypothetical protein
MADDGNCIHHGALMQKRKPFVNNPNNKQTSGCKIIVVRN